MSKWFSTAALAAGWLMIFVGIAVVSAPIALIVGGLLLLAAGVFAE